MRQHPVHRTWVVGNVFSAILRDVKNRRTLRIGGGTLCKPAGNSYLWFGPKLNFLDESIPAKIRREHLRIERRLLRGQGKQFEQFIAEVDPERRQIHSLQQEAALRKHLQ